MFVYGWSISKRDKLAVNGRGVSVRDGTLLNGMGC